MIEAAAASSDHFTMNIDNCAVINTECDQLEDVLLLSLTVFIVFFECTTGTGLLMMFTLIVLQLLLLTHHLTESHLMEQQSEPITDCLS